MNGVVLFVVGLGVIEFVMMSVFIDRIGSDHPAEPKT